MVVRLGGFHDHRLFLFGFSAAAADHTTGTPGRVTRTSVNTVAEVTNRRFKNLSRTIEQYFFGFQMLIIGQLKDSNYLSNVKPDSSVAFVPHRRA